MAKQQKQQGQGTQKNSGGQAGSVTENIKRSEAGRERNRNERKARAKHREAERQNGSFYLRVNADRSSDIFAAIRGEAGEYAHPGGNSPSIHFNVRREAFADGPMSVIRLEAIQKGHELEGEIFDPKVYVLCMQIQKFGLHFQSKFKDRLVATTQELIVHHLAREASKPAKMQAEELPALSENMGAMLSETDGTYIVRRASGDVTLKVFHRGRQACVRVVSSSNATVQVSDIFVPIHCLFEPVLNKVVPDQVYEQQLAIFMFIRTELGALIEKMNHPEEPPTVKNENPHLTDADREALQKAAERRERKGKDKFVRQREAQTQAVSIFAMRRTCVPALQIATGKLGYADLSSSSGELIIAFHMSGADRIARIEHMGECHMLKLAGIEKGTSIFASAIMTGKIERAHCTSDAEFRKHSILAEHIREQMEVRGIRFRKAQPA